MPRPHDAGLPPRAVPMRVIVCGVHRTGTMSIRSALWQLGFHDCYHMLSIKDRLETDPPQWIRALEAKYAGQGRFQPADWDRLLGHCQASCDLPAALFAADLADVYPEAKVVVLTRDPEQWYESVLHSVYRALRPRDALRSLQHWYCYLLDPQYRNWSRLISALCRLALPFDHGREKAKAMAWFEAQYGEFRQRIAPERRIEYSIRDGWQPLCRHLGVPVPMVRDEASGDMVEAPFPRVNDREAFAAHSRQADRQSLTRANSNLSLIMGRLALVGAVAYAGFQLWAARFSHLRR